MWRKPYLAARFCLCVCSIFVSAQTQTTGRIAGIVRDVQGAAIANANILAEQPDIGEKWTATTDKTGSGRGFHARPGRRQRRNTAFRSGQCRPGCGRHP